MKSRSSGRDTTLDLNGQIMKIDRIGRPENHRDGKLHLIWRDSLRRMLIYDHRFFVKCFEQG